MELSNKKLIIILSILVFLFGAIIIFLLFSPNITIAKLSVEKENVFVNGWKVLGEQVLKESDEIYVSETGRASLVLYDGVHIVLEPGTTITLKNLAKKNLEISQKGGGTWNQFIESFEKGYTIKTNGSVAFAKEAEFYLNDSLIFVGKGEVYFDANNKSFVVEENKAMEQFGELYRERDMTSEEKEKITANQLIK